MGAVIRFLKANTLPLGFAAFAIPLVLLLWFQYVWLNRLERASAVAQQAAFQGYLDAMSKEATLFYRSKAERLLDIPRDVFLKGDLSGVAAHWKNADFSGIRRLYAVKYAEAVTGNYYFYDPVRRELVPAMASDESVAVIVACLPWQAWVRGAVTVPTGDFHVYEQDPGHRIVLNPILDEERKVIAIVVMILDENYLRKTLLKTVTGRALGNLFPGQDKERLVVNVTDKENRLVYGSAADADSVLSASVKLPFVFRDLSLNLYSKGLSPEQWARRSFVSNMALAILLIVAVLCGILLSLRTASRAMKLSEMKSDFVSNVSHELRTPLASIRVFAEFLRMGKVSNQQKVAEYGELIEMETQRLTRLVDNILDFSRIETDRKIYHFAPADPAVVVEAVLKSFSLRLKQAGFELRTEMPEDHLLMINADPDAIGQALHNLLDNAVKYSAENKEITVRLFKEANDCVISVKDRGIGISRDEQERIFERFHRVSTKLVHDTKGSGLGLAIVYHIMKAHGGTVRVESEPGVGSTFCLRLPIGTRSLVSQDRPAPNGTKC